MKTHFLSLALLALVFSACRGGPDERPETINKLRAIGTSSNPVGLSTSEPTVDTVVITAFALHPKSGLTIQVEPFNDPFATATLPSPLVVKSQKSTDYSGMTLYEITLTTQIPLVQVTVPEGATFISLRYGIRLTIDGDQEDVVGNLVVYKDKVPWTLTPAVAIAEPTVGSSNSANFPLVATLNDQEDEGYRVGWFTTSGSIANRRALNTKIKDVSQGDHTLLVTARGLKSGHFTLQAATFKVD